MLTIRKICGGKDALRKYGFRWCEDPEKFLVPIDTTVGNQVTRKPKRVNRLLPIGHRCRGDVA